MHSEQIYMYDNELARRPYWKITIIQVMDRATGKV